MVQVISTPMYAAGYLSNERRTREEQRNARSINNTYRKALVKINRNTHVTLYMGEVKKKLASTDLMIVLRDCRDRLAKEKDFSTGNYAFFAETLRYFAKMRFQVYLSTARLLRLRKLAYGAKHDNAPAPPAPKSGPSLKQLLARDAMSKRGRARAAVQPPPVTGCKYQDPGSGDRCGAPCEGTHCDAHKNHVPAYNGSGSHFYALNKKESNPHRR